MQPYLLGQKIQQGDKKGAISLLVSLHRQKPNAVPMARIILRYSIYQEYALFTLARFGYVDWLEDFLKVTPINLIDTEGNTALHIAAGEGRTAFCDELIRRRLVLPNLQRGYQWPINKNGENPLHSAAIGGHVNLLLHFKEIYQSELDLHATTANGDTITHLLVRNGNRESLHIFLKSISYFSSHHFNKDGLNPLMLALAMKRPDLVKILSSVEVDSRKQDTSSTVHFFKLPSGEVFPINIEMNRDTVLRVKEKIAEKMGLLPEEIILVFNGRALEDECTIKSYNENNAIAIDDDCIRILYKEIRMPAPRPLEGTLSLIEMANNKPSDAKNPELFYRQGLAQTLVKQYQLAIETLNQALRLNPQFVDAYKIRASVYEKLHQYHLAQLDRTRLYYCYIAFDFKKSIFKDQGLERVWGGKYQQVPIYNPVGPKPAGAYPGAIFEKSHTSPDPKNSLKHWLGKPGVKEDIGDKKGSALEGRLARRLSRDALREKIAADCYEALCLFSGSAYRLPKHRLAWLPILNPYTETHRITKSILEEAREEGIELTHTTYIMSKIVPDYQDLSKAQVKTAEGTQSYLGLLKRGEVSDTLLVEGKEIPLLGLMELLAASRLLSDIDVLGNNLTNAGFSVVRQRGEPRYAYVIKIDPGWAFSFSSDRNRFYHTQTFAAATPYESLHEGLKDSRDIQTGTGKKEEFVLPWSVLTTKQKERFLMALHMGSQLLNNQEWLDYLFLREGRFNQGPDPALMKPEWVYRYIRNLRINIQAQEKVYQTDWKRVQLTLSLRPTDALSHSFAQLGLGNRLGALSALHVAVQKGNLNRVRSLLTSHTLHDQHNAAGDTPLHLAVRHGHLPIIQLLLQNKADIHRVNRKYQSVLPSPLLATESVHPDIQIALLRHPAPVNSMRVKQILRDASEHYRGRLTDIQEDIVILNHAVGLLLGQADTVEKKQEQRRIYLAHLLSMKGTPEQDLEGMPVPEFLSLRVLSYVEIWLKHALDSQPDLPPGISKIQFLETLEKEIILACETFKWNVAIQIACYLGEKASKGKEAVIDNFIDRLSQLSEGEELLFPTSRPGHCIYAAFYRRGNDLVTRIDNLFLSDVKGRHVEESVPGNRQRMKVYSYFLKKVSLSQASQLKHPILNNLLQANTLLDPRTQIPEALKLIYLPSAENRLETIQREGYPALEIQSVDNCVAYSYSVGLQYRLKPILYDYLMEKESALSLRPPERQRSFSRASGPPAVVATQLPLRGGSVESVPFQFSPSHSELMKYLSKTLEVPFEQVTTGCVVEEALVSMAGLSDDQVNSSYRSFEKERETRFRLFFKNPVSVEQFVAYYQRQFGQNCILKRPQELKNGFWEIRFDTLILVNQIIPNAKKASQPKKDSCCLS